MPDPKKPKIDKRSPPPGPGVSDEVMDDMMKSMEDTRKKIQGGPQTTSLSDLRNGAVGLAKKRAEKKKKKAEKK